MEHKTKKILLISLASVAGLVLSVALIWLVVFMSQFHGYKDKNYRFSIKYPAQWDKVVAPQGGAAVVFVSPKENALDIFRENVNVTVQDVPGHIASLKSFTDQMLTQMSAVFNNMSVVENKQIDMGGRPAMWVVFEAQKPDAIRVLTVVTIKGAQHAYILTYVASARKYPQYLPFVQEMVRSFKFN